MRAAVLKEFYDVDVENIQVPEIGDDEALVKVQYAGICGSDIHVFSGKHPAAKPPIVLGHEFCGELVKINTKKETDLIIGDKVVVQPFTGCNGCDICIQGRDNICSKLSILGIHRDGCFAEYVKVPLRKVYSIPYGTDMRVAALTEPLAVAIHDVRRSDLKVGQTVLVVGGGPIGVLIAMAARMNGASGIVVSEINKSRINFIRSMGFDIINPLECDAVNEVSSLTGGKRFDVVFEVSGVKPGIELAFKGAKIGGTIVMVGIPSGSIPLDTGTIIYEELDVKGVRIHSQISFATAVELVKSGTLNTDLSKLITNVFPLDNVKEAIKFSIEDQEHFKVLLEI